eukprot:scaffold16263_cov39-Cyclotella_meneghiniana.AAC.1
MAARLPLSIRNTAISIVLAGRSTVDIMTRNENPGRRLADSSQSPHRHFRKHMLQNSASGIRSHRHLKYLWLISLL